VTLEEARELARSLPPVITVAQGGALLGLGRAAAYEAVQRGELPALRFGRRLLVPTACVLALLGLDPTNSNGGEPDQLAAAIDAPGEDRRGATYTDRPSVR
jgi:excisionase family DNA binding protein